MNVGQVSLNDLRFMLNEMADWRVMVPHDRAESDRARRLSDLEEEMAPEPST